MIRIIKITNAIIDMKAIVNTLSCSFFTTTVAIDGFSDGRTAGCKVGSIDGTTDGFQEGGPVGL